MASTDCGVSV